jgi:hypothetical protein
MAAYGNMDKGLPGELVGLEVTHQIDSRLAKGAVPFGGLCFGTGDGEQVTAKGEGALLGIAARTALDTPEYVDGEAVNVCRTGKIFGTAGEAISADAEVSVNASTGKIVAKTSAAAGAKRTVTITVSGTSAASKVVTAVVGEKVAQVNTTDDVKAAADVAAALKTALAALDIPFVATVASAVVTLTAKEKGVAANDIAVTATTTDGTQTLTVANGTSGSDVVLNPGWFARSTAENANDLVIVDLG